jgi:hypothetical protein
MSERLQLPKGGLIELMDQSRSGIHKKLFWLANTEISFITVQDDNGPDFSIDIPKKADMPEGKNPLWYWDHCMLFGPESDTQRKIYA